MRISEKQDQMNYLKTFPYALLTALNEMNADKRKPIGHAPPGPRAPALPITDPGFQAPTSGSRPPAPSALRPRIASPSLWGIRSTGLSLLEAPVPHPASTPGPLSSQERQTCASLGCSERFEGVANCSMMFWSQTMSLAHSPPPGAWRLLLCPWKTSCL